MEAETLGVIGGRERIADIFMILLNFDRWVGGDLVAELFTITGGSFNWNFNQNVVILEHIGFEIFAAVCIEHFSVKIISNTSAILDLAHHVLNDIHDDGEIS